MIYGYPQIITDIRKSIKDIRNYLRISIIQLWISLIQLWISIIELWISRISDFVLKGRAIRFNHLEPFLAYFSSYDSNQWHRSEP
jgi:hypothetical protein